MPNLVFESEFFITAQGLQYSRAVYSFFDLLGDLGGLSGLCSYVIMSLLSGVSYHSYILSVVKQLFMIRSDNLVVRDKGNCQANGGIKKYLSKEVTDKVTDR